MSTLSTITPRGRWRTRFGAVLAGTAIAATGLVAGAGTAGAATGTITGATFEWGINAEVQGAAQFGGCNYLSAGQSNGTQAQYQTTSGNVSVVKDGTTPTWATKCTLTAGAANQKVVLTGGTGTLDPVTGASTIQFTGTFSVNFYGGLAPFSVQDPKLVVNADGTGQLTATTLGYAASMDNPGVIAPLPAVPNVVVANLSGVNGKNTSGFTATPNYLGVEYNAPVGGTAQNRVNAGWGSWPTSWVDFQNQTGLSSYWCSSGGATDDKKAPSPFTVGYGTYTPPATGSPAITAAPNSSLDPAAANTVTVTGTGFTTLPAGSAGVYVGFVPAATWQPGQVPNQAAFSGTKFIPSASIVSGAFTTTVTIPAGTVTDTSATYGIGTFCAHGCATTNRTLDTFAAVGFVSAPVGPGVNQQNITATVVEEAGEFSWSIDAADHNVSLGTAVNQGSYLQATGSLKPVSVTDTRAGAPAWSISGQLGDFTGGLSGKYLGWTPSVLTAGAGATPGTVVAPGITSGNGLKDSSVLASATAGHVKGTGSVGANLDLRVPVATPAGSYTATLTLTALS